MSGLSLRTHTVKVRFTCITRVPGGIPSANTFQQCRKEIFTNEEAATEPDLHIIISLIFIWLPKRKNTRAKNSTSFTGKPAYSRRSI